ncbi:MAG TPA: type II toxin-antitoxin system prevent-host-death family antitoxin [Candidatus Agrococcus pullicola]|uniref:Antitoxin n=1 Tax=Candidatus Agrococcus pullicola TaxID=2838429 RepID=A0A9D1YWP5_9MICO|nr:type II toxin-antitoxin system prevent-host-death family antitoxin [Candidatus Agrococcus pullicola]
MVNVYEAKSSFSKLLARAESGESVVIARNGRPVAQLGPVQPQDRVVVFGDLKGRVDISEDFDDWSDADERDWYGS